VKAGLQETGMEHEMVVLQRKCIIERQEPSWANPKSSIVWIIQYAYLWTCCYF